MLKSWDDARLLKQSIRRRKIDIGGYDEPLENFKGRSLHCHESYTLLPLNLIEVGEVLEKSKIHPELPKSFAEYCVMTDEVIHQYVLTHTSFVNWDEWNW